MTADNGAIMRAAHLGEQHGRNAVDWMIMDPMQRAGFEDWLFRIVKGYEDGDPAILDALPRPDLSGEWADGWTPHMLAYECGVDVDAIVADDPDAEDLGELCDEYEDGFYQGVERRIYEAYTYFTEDVTG